LVVKPAVVKVNRILESAGRPQDFEQTFSEDVYNSLKTASFDVWKYDEDAMQHFLVQMLVRMNVVKQFAISIPALKNFVHTLRQCYNPNPFHNFKHAFCVTQMVIHILRIAICASSY
jgi:high affinity cGMP-specific 3',5'-cyclic phosphodiesterase 9